MLNELILLTAESFAIAYFIWHLRKTKVPFFSYIVFFGVACLSLGQLYNIVQLIVAGFVPAAANVGLLGVIGGYGFFFSSVYSQMDSLVDGGEKEYRKYRLAAAAAAILLLLFVLPVLRSPLLTDRKIVCAVTALLFALTGYYNVKQLLLPDVTFGILRSIRAYNLLIYLLSVTLSFRTICEAYAKGIGVTVFSVLAALILAVLMPALQKGTEKWRA